MITSLFLKIDSIRGGSMEDDHIGWIPIRDYSWPGAVLIGSDPSKISSIDVRFRAPRDPSFGPLMISATRETLIGEAKLDWVHGTFGNWVFTLNNCFVRDLIDKGDWFSFTLTGGKFTGVSVK
jgi:type VI protein secretion system component Hcp